MDKLNKNSFLLIPKGNQIKSCLIIPRWKDGKTDGYFTAISTTAVLPLDVCGSAENKSNHKGRWQEMKKRLRGEITNKLSGYGFIRADGRDFFFHKSEVEDGYFNAIEPGMTAEFTPSYESPKGPSAEQVNIKSKGSC